YNINMLLCQNIIDLGKNTGHILVNMDQAMCIGQLWQLYIWKVNAQVSASCIDIFHYFGRNKSGYIFLCFFSASSNMWAQDYIGQSSQLTYKRLLIALRLRRKNIYPTTCYRFVFDSLFQC